MEEKKNSTTESVNINVGGLGSLMRLLEKYGAMTLIVIVVSVIGYKYFDLQLERMRMEIMNDFSDKVYLVSGSADFNDKTKKANFDLKITQINKVEIQLQE